MKYALCVVLVCMTAACGGAGGSVGPNLVADSTQAVETSPDRSFQGMLNEVRAVNGAAPVTFNNLLYDAAKGHADDMHAQNYFSHTSLDGRQLRDRVNATGYQWRRIGENIGRGQRDEEAILLAWVNSPGHQANNVHPDFEEFGLAKTGTGSRQYWVLVLADPR